ncbi:MAG: methyltransferase domain-containing protein [Candidatus Thorarchaeota archaeon]
MKKTRKDLEKFYSQLELPFLETNNKFIKDIFQALELEYGLERNSNQKFIDLGSGNGSVVIYAALNYNIKSFGIEIDQNLKNEANNRILSLKKEGNYKKKVFKKIKIKLGDLFLLNLKDYDFIYIYSLPPMQKYLMHIFNTAKNGAIFISHKYQLEGFNSVLKDEYKLVHKKGNQKIYTYFYKKIISN